ncbi:MAG TPA: MBL fold metallo-hydrolase [Terriglobales bacterium]|jgi:glyoxylase-like metal-dependent hydrolase (beta-lactamase superfamily II)|nr:MBL fold metallo-hydrolase [Terriglobales bacterium]
MPAHQQAAHQEKAAPRLTLGDFELTLLSDGTYWLDGGAFFGVVPKPLWEKKMKADERNRLAVGMNSVLVRTGKHTVLIETGMGNKLSEKQKRISEPQEKLLASLEAAGVAPDQIDVVINTHLHFDHCGWNTVYEKGQAVATFPKARYYVQEGEWRHASLQHERDRVSYLSDNYDPLIRNGQMRLLHGDGEIVPGISVKVYPGHTRNLQAVMLRSGGKKACYVSDLVPTTAHLDLTWVMAYDLFPLETIESRKRLWEVAVPEQWLMIFTHDHHTPWAYVERGEGEGRYVAHPV